MELLCESQSKSKRNGRSKGRGGEGKILLMFSLWGAET